MNIEFVNNYEEAIKCNELLTKLIKSEKEFNENINENYKVSEWFENFYNNSMNVIIVAKDNEVIVGYLFCRITTVDNGPMIEHEALLDGLYVESEYRNKGIATQLINSAKKWCMDRDVKYLNLEVYENNVAALNLYHKAGFKELERKLRLKIDVEEMKNG